MDSETNTTNMEGEGRGTPISVSRSLTSSTSSPLMDDTPTTDTAIGEESLRDQVPRRKLSFSQGTNLDQPPLSLIKGADWPDVIPSIWHEFVRAATEYPDSLAVASTFQKGKLLGLSNLALDHNLYQREPYVRWSYAELGKGVTCLIGALQRQGVKEGFPIFTFVNNCAEFPLIFWAAASLGCTIVPVHPRNLLNKEEATHIITKAISASPVDNAIIFAQTANLAKQVLDLKLFYKTTVVVIDTDASDANHIGSRLLPEFMAENESDTVLELLGLERFEESASKWSLIIFTSGTTALPKGVVQDATRWDRWMENRQRSVPVVHGDSCFLTLPTNHAFYPMSLLAFHRCGGAVVLPGPSFAPQTAPDLFAMEGCTHFPTAPAMVYALSQIAKEKDIKFSTLKSVTCGGSKLSKETVQGVLHDMGSEAIEIAYGCTEAGVASSTGNVSTVEELDRQDDITVGRPAVGGVIKICAPGETTALPRNTEGELHYQSLITCNGYVGGDMPSTFYTDDNGQRWIATGDAATINDEGLIFIVGRIKDMIVRGGVNISPAAIEFTLASEPATQSFGIQIVGKSDIIAGEVPIAIAARAVSLVDVDVIQDTILRRMGPVFLPEEILSLEQLELSDFPKTMLGKVQKGKLKKLVENHMQMRHASDADGELVLDELTTSVQKIWTRTIGHSINIDAQIADYADSITIMRVRDRLAKEMGVPISLSDMLSKKTARDHIGLIREQKRSTANGQTATTPSPANSRAQQGDALTHRDIVHFAADPRHFSVTRAYINDRVGEIGLAWEDIQAITPAADFTQVLTQADILNTSWSWKFAFLAKPGIDMQSLRRGIEVMLSNNPILASLLLWKRPVFGSDIALHVMFKHNKKLFDRIFRDYGEVATKEEFSDLVYKPYEYEMALLPGLLVQFLLFDVKETGQSGTIMVAHHVPVDATYMQLLFDDLDKAIGGAMSLDPHVDYKTWADSFYSLRTSHEARVAVDWHVDRLSDLSSYHSSVFPPLPRPHHYVAQLQHIQGIADNGYHTDFHAFGITALKRTDSTLNNPTIIKSAWCLLNMYRNGTSTAIFSNLQANRRRFPFIPPALEALAPPDTFSATNVAGPTLQDVVNIIPLHSAETVLEFMMRVAADQEELNAHAAAPLKTILEDIGTINAEIMLDVLRSQIFNWTPGLGAMQIANPNENYEPLSSFIRPSLRLVINVDVGGKDDETVYAQIKSPLYDMDGLRGIAKDFEDLVLWLCDQQNWAKQTSEYKSALRGMSAKNAEGNDASKRQHVM